MIKYEKSVGAIIYYVDSDNQFHYLVQQHQNGSHWAFAKGHVEHDETEEETALREIQEETNITDIKLDTNFRETTVYSPKEGVEKEVIYFAAETTQPAAKAVQKQESEIIKIDFLTFEKALERVTYKDDKNILKKANQFLTQ